MFAWIIGCVVVGLIGGGMVILRTWLVPRELERRHPRDGWGDD